MTRQEKVDMIKSNVSIQEYFNKVIIPYMGFYYDGEKPDFEYKPTCKCPLHSEDTSSFRYYSYSNTYYCFGCASGGDLIALHRNFMDVNMATKVSFDDAVNYLYATFVEGKKGVKASRKQAKNLLDLTEGEPLSTNKELLVYGRYRTDLERRLLKKEMPLQDKLELYIKVDEIDKLVNMNLINATDGLNELKSAEGINKAATKIVYKHS